MVSLAKNKEICPVGFSEEDGRKNANTADQNGNKITCVKWEIARGPDVN